MSEAAPHPVQRPPQPQGHKEFEPGHHPGHDHPAHLAHHWETPVQQFEAGKLGMWLFLATEVLLFGGLFCAYAIWRGAHPELFKYGSQFLDTTLGAINTAVLIASSLTMAWGVTCAQKNQKTGLIICLILTLAGATTFLVIKYFEYSHKFHQNLYPGIRFYQASAHHDTGAQPHALHVDETLSGESTPGTAPAHGVQRSGEAVKTGGVETGGVETGVVEDASKGANPQPAAAGASATTPTATAHPSTANPTTQPATGQFELQTIAVTPSAAAASMPAVEASSIAPAAIGPAGMKAGATFEAQPMQFITQPQHLEGSPLQDPNRPDNTHMFFNIYFMMTGLHGIHVVIGMIVIIWLLIRAFMGHFSNEYFTPVDLGGLYWHIVDLIWIFLFPLFYLI